jgi:hypothetical protein
MHGICRKHFPREIIDSALTVAKKLTGPDFSYTLWSTGTQFEYLYPAVFCCFDQYYRGLRVINNQINLMGISGFPIQWNCINNTFLTEKDAIPTTPKISSEQALTIAQSDTSLMTYNSHYIIDAQTSVIMRHQQECTVRCIRAPCPCGGVLPDLEPQLVIYNGHLAYELRISKSTTINNSRAYHSSKQLSQCIKNATGLIIQYYCESNMMVQVEVVGLDGKINQKIFSGYQKQGQHSLFYRFDRHTSQPRPQKMYILRIRSGKNEMVHHFCNF